MSRLTFALEIGLYSVLALTILSAFSTLGAGTIVAWYNGFPPVCEDNVLPSSDSSHLNPPAHPWSTVTLPPIQASAIRTSASSTLPPPHIQFFGIVRNWASLGSTIGGSACLCCMFVLVVINRQEMLWIRIFLCLFSSLLPAVTVAYIWARCGYEMNDKDNVFFAAFLSGISGASSCLWLWLDLEVDRVKKALEAAIANGN